MSSRMQLVLFLLPSKSSPLIINHETRTLMLFQAVDLASVITSVDISMSDFVRSLIICPTVQYDDETSCQSTVCNSFTHHLQ